MTEIVTGEGSGSAEPPVPPATGGPAQGSPRSPIAPALVAAATGLILPALAIVTALVVGALIIVFSDPDTLDAWSGFFSDPLGALDASWDVVWISYKSLFESAFGSQRALARTLVEATPLILAGLAVALAFKAGLFNIGGAGQIVIGSTAAAYVGIHADLPGFVHVTACLVAGFAGGAVWGGIAGFLKARTGAHEVICTIMLNFIGLRLLDYALTTEPYQREGRADPISPEMASSARLPTLGGDFRVHLGFLIAVGAAVVVWWLLQRTTVGFRMRAVGANPHAAAYAGMGVAATTLLSMALAGGLAGLAGTSILLGSTPRLTGGYFAFIGFDAIALALLGRSSPIGVVGAGLLFGALRAGATGMQASTSTPIDIIQVIQALIIVFVAAPVVIRALYRVREEQLRGGAGFTTRWGAT